MKLQLQALKDFIGKYRFAFQEAWAHRAEYAPLIRKPHEAEFLPASLALQETPVHPTPRVFMWVIMLFVLLAVLWSIFGRIDVVAVASGKLVPDSRSKIIQPMEVAAIKAIHVRDGQLVKAGNVLVELDSTVTDADIERLEQEKTSAELEALRFGALLAAHAEFEKESNVKKRSSIIPQLINSNLSIDQEKMQSELQWAIGEFDAYKARLLQFNASLNRREADKRAIESVVKKHQETLPITRQRETDYQNLLDKKFIAKHEYLELKTALIEQERDLIAQEERLAEIKASYTETLREKNQYTAETKRLWLDKLNEASQNKNVLVQDVIKAKSRGQYMTLTAPVDGVVQQLSVHTLNGVVTPAQALMVIVPQDGPIEVEAFLPNKDVGFVKENMPVEVKLETFSFTKYGTVDGEVISVSSDAIQDEKLGLVFGVRVRLKENTIMIDGRTVNLTPGMAATVEVKTTQRRVIEYFLDPFLRHTNESLRER